MAADAPIPAKYDVAIVESAILEVAAELHPRHLTADELSRQIVSDADDSREVRTAAHAISNLREFGLFRDRDDEIVEPTQAALRAVALLTGSGAGVTASGETARRPGVV
jgi:hypothetical protein